MFKLVLVFSIYFVSTVNAYAYLDPGTGSVIISAIIAAFVSIKVYWNYLFQKIKKFFIKNNNKKND